MDASILLDFVDACSNPCFRSLHAKQEQFAFIVSAFYAVAQFYAALLSELVLTFHFHICVDSSAEKRVRGHYAMANLYDCSALFRRGLL